MKGQYDLLKLENLTKKYHDQIVVNSLNLTVKKNEFVSLLGPSGCGKTTTLRMTGGFEKPDEGRIIFNNKIMNEIPPHLRPVNTVFQHYALFPHLTVGENIAFGLECSGKGRKEIRMKTGEMLDLVNLPGLQKRRIHSLSGGQQQRIAIARALVNQPSLLLLDEPLGALDLKLRQNMQKELKRIQQQIGITFLYVTHDQEEALSLSDYIAVMNNGIIQQLGTPEDIYNEPQNPFVASFVGESNIVSGRMKNDGFVSFCGNDFICIDKCLYKNAAVKVVIRPEDILFLPGSKDSDKKNSLKGKVLSTTFKGVHWEMTIEVNKQTWLAHNTTKAEVGENIHFFIAPDSIHVMFDEERY